MLLSKPYFKHTHILLKYPVGILQSATTLISFSVCRVAAVRASLSEGLQYNGLHTSAIVIGLTGF